MPACMAGDLGLWDGVSLLACAGILDLKQAQEWVVTTKLGASDKRPGTQVLTLASGHGISARAVARASCS